MSENLEQRPGLIRRLLAPAFFAGFLLLKFGKTALFLLKFGKFATLYTMLLSIWVYAFAFGLPYAIGFVLLIFVHELGHALMLRRLGIGAGLPVFIPFVGAFISMRDMPRDAWRESLVGIAGPFLGTVAAMVVLFFAEQSDSMLLFALAQAGFMINLFNMLPISPMDGGRIVGGVSRIFLILGYAVGVYFYWLHPNGLLLLMLILGALHIYNVFRYPIAGYFDVSYGKKLTMGFSYLVLLFALFQLHAHTQGILKNFGGLSIEQELSMLTSILLYGLKGKIMESLILIQGALRKCRKLSSMIAFIIGASFSFAGYTAQQSTLVPPRLAAFHRNVVLNAPVAFSFDVINLLALAKSDLGGQEAFQRYLVDHRNQINIALLNEISRHANICHRMLADLYEITDPAHTKLAFTNLVRLFDAASEEASILAQYKILRGNFDLIQNRANRLAGEAFKELWEMLIEEGIENDEWQLDLVTDEEQLDLFRSGFAARNQAFQAHRAGENLYREFRLLKALNEEGEGASLLTQMWDVVEGYDEISKNFARELGLLMDRFSLTTIGPKAAFEFGEMLSLATLLSDLNHLFQFLKRQHEQVINDNHFLTAQTFTWRADKAQILSEGELAWLATSSSYRRLVQLLRGDEENEDDDLEHEDDDLEYEGDIRANVSTSLHELIEVSPNGVLSAVLDSLNP